MFTYFTIIYSGFDTQFVPLAFFTVSLTVYFPALVYLCIGFLTVEVLLSPKSQDHEVGLLVLLSVNVTTSGAFPVIGEAEKAGTGGFKRFTTIKLDFVTLLLPAAFVTVKLTVYFPALLYICTGFLSVEVSLSPKFQRYDVGDPLLLSVNLTFNGNVPDVGEAKN